MKAIPIDLGHEPPPDDRPIMVYSPLTGWIVAQRVKDRRGRLMWVERGYEVECPSHWAETPEAPQ